MELPIQENFWRSQPITTSHEKSRPTTRCDYANARVDVSGRKCELAQHGAKAFFLHFFVAAYNIFPFWGSFNFSFLHVSILNSTLSRFFFHPERQVARCH
jgi:hypothetical protein